MHKIISFDIWDTLIKRRCNPEEIKLFTAKYLLLKYENNIKKEYRDIYVILKERDEIEGNICNSNKEQGYDDECRIFDVFNMLQKKIFIKEEKSIANELIRVEIDHEKKMIYLNEDIKELLEKYKDEKKYCISDFYMGKEALREIISSIDELKDKFVDIYSSADYLINKKSGKLYKKFEEDLGISAENHIHVGDNEYSDILVAGKLGIKTIKIRKYGEFDFKPVPKRAFNFKLDELMYKNTTEKNEKLFNMGVKLAPLLYFFVNNLVEYGVKNEIPQIYYQTREGETFIKIHEMIEKNNPYGLELPKPRLLEVSRVATFSASIKEFSISEMLRLWSQYRGQSLESMFKSLNIDIKNYEEIIKKYNLKSDEYIREPWFNINIQRLFADEVFKSKINEEIKNKRLALIKFFESKGIKDNNEPMWVVDLGWRGTIQDNIAYIYPNKQVNGYYYALFDYYNLQPKNTYKMAFLKNLDFCYDYVAPMITLFEMLFNPESGSVVGYEGNMAVRKVKESEYNTVKNITSHIQKGMFAGAKRINDYLFCHPYLNEEFEQYILELIKNLKENPSKEIVEAYYGLVHNDTFGTGEYVDKRQRLSRWDKLNLLKCRNLLKKEQWKEAFIIHNDTKVLDGILKFKAKLRALRRG